MTGKQLDALLPMLYGLIVVVSVFTFGHVAAVAVIGAVALSIYYAVFRRQVVVNEGGGRDRDR